VTVKRIRFQEHGEKQVLVIDLSGLGEKEVVPVLVDAARETRTHPPRSLLTLTDATTTTFNLRTESGEYDRVAAASVRNCIVGNAKHVKAAAVVVGHDESKRVIAEFFNRVSERQFEIFDTMEEALDWLVSQ
jgi:hypothetical protein